MNEHKDQGQIDFWGELSPVELKAAAEITQAFLMAVKNYGLFPPEHASTINMLRGLCANLNSFVNKYGGLRIYIERGRIRYEDEVVYEEFDPDNNPAFVFFRDGILWLEFLEGLEPYEVLQFFRVTNRFKTIQEEPEGDLVTELWTADLPHIHYGVSDNLWEAEPVLEFSLLNPEAKTFLEHGGGAEQPGFDLLKSVLGLVSESSESGGDAQGLGGAHTAGLGTAGPAGMPEDLADGRVSPVRGSAGSDSGLAHPTSASVGGDGAGPGMGGAAGPVSAGAEINGMDPGAAYGGSGGGGAGGSGSGPGGSGSGSAGSGMAEGLDDGPGSGQGDGSGSVTGGSGSGDGNGAPGDVGLGSVSTARAEVKKDEPGELDFWEALKSVNPVNRSGAKAEPERITGNVTDDVQISASSHPAGAISGKNANVQPGADVKGGSGGTAGPIEGKSGGGRKSRKTGSKRGQTDELLKGKDASPVSDAASRKATAFSRPGRGGDWSDDDSSESENYISVNVASIEPGHSLWNFTEEEHRTLKQMVHEYEDEDNSGDVIEVLLILLKMEDEPQIVLAIIGFMKEEFRIALANRNFKIAHYLLVEIDRLRWQPGMLKDWALPMLDKFLEDIAEPEILDALAPLWADLPTLDHGSLQDFASILKLLPPKSGEALINMSAQVEFGKGRRILIDLVATFASRELDILEKMLSRPEEDLILRLIGVLRAAPDRDRAEKLLFKAIKHPKEKVRQKVCDILLDRETEEYDKLFLLIHDPSPVIRARIFEYFSRERNWRLEQLFAAHIASERFLSQDNEHISRCYQALGACGSDESLDLLKKILFGQPWNFMVGLGQRIHRQGAAVALNGIRTPASMKILAEAESSSIPHVRKAWMKATGN